MSTMLLLEMSSIRQREVDKHYKYTLKDDDAVIELVDDGGDDGGGGECSDGEEV